MEFPGSWAFPISTLWLSVLRNHKCSSSHSKSNAFLEREWKHMVFCLSCVHRVNMDRVLDPRALQGKDRFWKTSTGCFHSKIKKI